MENTMHSGDTVTSYFLLQLRMAGRRSREFGMHPVLGAILLITSIVLLSFLLYNKTELAPYIIALVAISLAAPLSDLERANFLKSCFENRQYFLIRILENVLIVVPFIVILCIKTSYLPAVLLLLVVLVFALTKQGTIINRSIPTPFGSKPFEFLIGFRKTIFVFPMIVFVMIMAISVDNFNLGIFSLLLIFVISLTFYGTPENLFYVWVDQNSPKRFLLQKVLVGIWHSFILSFPLAVVLAIFYPSRSLYVLLTLIVGQLFLITMILAKYSSYPQEINLPQGILFAICIFFPPAIVVVIPILYSQSIKRLAEILT